MTAPLGGVLLFAIVKDIAELVLAITGIYFALVVIVKWRQPWVQRLKQQRLLVLWVIVLGVLLAKVSEDVLALESGPVDEAVLAWIHTAVPSSLLGLFQAATLSASSTVIFVLLAVSTAALLAVHQRFASLVLGSSVLAAVSLVYVVKTLVGRERPALWETQWYWGASFPSGHTMTSAAFATAACICVTRRWPRARWPAFAIATLWVSLVALSRLVLGAHWPTDVLAAACAGVLVALAADATLLVLRQRYAIRAEKQA